MPKCACERYGHFDVLVNNAGIGPIPRFDALQVEEWDAVSERLPFDMACAMGVCLESIHHHPGGGR